MKQNSVAIVGAAETTDLGKIPNLSQIGLHADAALNAQWRLTRQAMRERDSEADKPDWDDRPGYFDTLLEAQRAWITYRDAHCRSEGYSARGGSLEPLLVSTCKTHLTKLRTAQLRELAETY